MKYFFILGHNPTLSTAEIINILPKWIGEFQIRELSEEVLILETENKMDVQKLQKELGGTIKIGQILTRIDAKLTRIDADIFLKELLRGFGPSRGQTLEKIFFGFSIYKLNQSVDVKRLMPQIKKLAMEIKKKLRENGVASRWVISKERILSSVIVQKNKLLTQGAEFCLFLKRTDTDKFLCESVLNQYKSVLVGKTLTCQEFEEYEFYDFGRPARAIEQGMLPPKFAKIMINLSYIADNRGLRPRKMDRQGKRGLTRIIDVGKRRKELTILDPFCGSGTILQEAVRLGYNNIVGTDISEEAVENAKKNMEWLIKLQDKKIITAEAQKIATPEAQKPATTETQNETEIQKISEFQRSQSSEIQRLRGSEIQRLQKKIRIFQCDVRDLSKRLPQNSVDTIVTEPYLGPIKISDLRFKIKDLIPELSDLYLSAFQEFKKVLKSNNSRVVIVFPVFKNSLNSRELGSNDICVSEKILNTIKQMGFQVVAPIPKSLKNHPVVKLTPRDSIIYFRPDQHVLREIFIFIRNS